MNKKLRLEKGLRPHPTHLQPSHTDLVADVAVHSVFLQLQGLERCFLDLLLQRTIRANDREWGLVCSGRLSTEEDKPIPPVGCVQRL